MPDIEQEILGIKQTLAEVGLRVGRLERRAGIPSTLGVDMATPVTPPTITSIDSLLKPVATTKSQPISNTKTESAITGKWFAIIGVITLLFGVGFFLKFAFENNLIGVTGRVILGLLAGLALLVTGDILARRERYRAYAFYLMGGGLALLYLSIYASFGFYHLIGQTAAFGFMILVTAGGVGLAARWKSETLATLALLGGFLTPLLLSSGTNQYGSLFTYLIILDLGFLVLSAFQRFTRLSLLTLLGTGFVFSPWYFRFYHAQFLGPTMLFLTLAFLIFLLAPTLRSLLRREISASSSESILAALNAAAYFGLSYSLLVDRYEPYLGFFFVLGAAIYLALGTLISAVNSADRSNILALSGVGLVLVTVAVPIQLDSQWITIAWAIEGVILTAIGFRLVSESLRTFALIVFAIMLVRLIAIDQSARGSLSALLPFMNERFATFLLGSLALFAVAYFYHRYRSTLTLREAKVPSVLGVAANLLLMLTLSQEVSVITNSANSKNLLWSLLWTAHAAVLMIVGIIWHSRAARRLAIVGFAVVIAKAFFVDIAQLSDLYRIISFISLSIVLLVLSFLSFRFRDTIKRFLLE
ncbi:MAG: DUF2339 domain-containing protein [Patescibacteria group bacterium]